ncbi:hypothetical protein L484_007005 [Morus notabilis]|uniref:Uncharacterized protein n=1 Tax=Morus notabilis TaxID=981085 RepID=W9RYM2_9ROSA|nr:hypothetical protein L484_007005 [Morus notabilis]
MFSINKLEKENKREEKNNTRNQQRESVFIFSSNSSEKQTGEDQRLRDAMAIQQRFLGLKAFTRRNQINIA